MLDKVQHLIDTADMWQNLNCRSVDSIIEKMEEEIEEFKEAKGKINRLDELGDVLVLVARLLTVLTPNELEFASRVSRMKANRRIIDPGVKDKEAEFVETLALAAEISLAE